MSRSSNGKQIALSSVAHLRTDVAPLTVAHLGQLPAVTISFNLQPGVSLGEAVDRVQQAAVETLPDTRAHQLPGRRGGLSNLRSAAWECCWRWRSW